MDFEILGPLRVIDNGVAVDVGSRKQRALLALLLVHVNRVVRTDRIIEELWPGEPDGHENALYVYISRLRSLLEPRRTQSEGYEVLVTRDHGYALQVPDQRIDARRFEAAIRAAGQLAREDPDAALAGFRDAEQEWKGGALDGVDAPFASVEATRLEELRVAALEDRLDLELKLGAAGGLVAEIEAAVDQHPFRERLIGQLMLARYRGGRQAEALRTFERFRRMLAEELGIDPSPELVRLEEQILLHDSRLQLRAPGRLQSPARVSAQEVNPFKGLRPFTEDDAADFFGRDQLVADVVRRIEGEAPLVALVGPSGSGKSSVVRAGVLPALRKGTWASRDALLVAEMVPGARPFAELEAALLRSTIDPPESLGDRLRSEDGLLGAALRLLPAVDAHLVVFIDQFEELFTLVDDDVRRAFLDALIPAIDDPHRRVTVLITLRADFYGRAIDHVGFGRRLGEGIVNVVPLTPDELEAAAVEPLRRAGCHFEPAVLVALLRDVAGEPGALPIFQYTLTELFDRRVDGTVTMAVHNQLGGVRGALARRAEDLFAALDGEEQRVARQVLLRLVTIDEGDAWGRRRVSAAEVLGLDVDVATLAGVLEEFGTYRLLSFDRDRVSGSPTLEVAHEALLSEWPRLHEWIAESQVDVRRRTSLGAAAAEWADAGRGADYLFTGSRLDDAEAWARQSTIALTELERDFLDTAVAKRDDDDRANAERAARERALDRRAKVRAAGLIALLGLVAAVGVWLVLFAGGDDPPRVARIDPGAGGSIQEQLANGWAQAERELDLTFDPPLRPMSDFLGEVNQVVDTAPDLVVLNGLSGDLGVVRAGLRSGDVESLIADNPNQLFAIPDDPGLEFDNLVSFEFASQEGSFLAGVAAAATSRSGTIGFVGGPPYLIDAFRAGFEAGARYERPDIEILSTYLVGYFGDVFMTGPGADAVTDWMIAQGADVIFHAAGEAGAVVLRTAAAHTERKVWVIGVDVDQSLVAPPEQADHVLTSMLKRHDLAVLEMLRRLEKGTLRGGVIRGGVANGVLGLAEPGNMAPAVLDAVDRARRALIDGEVEAPLSPSTPPATVPGVDRVVRVEMAPDCTASAFEAVAGDRVRLEARNSSSQARSLFVWRLADDVAAGDLSYEGLQAGDQSMGDVVSGMTVAPGATNALTARFDETGRWLVACFPAGNMSGPIDSILTGDAILVVGEPTATTERELSMSEATEGVCSVDLAGIRSTDVVEVRADNTTAREVEFFVAKFPDGTVMADLDEDNLFYRSGAVLLRWSSVAPGSTTSMIVPFFSPGTHFFGCFQFDPDFERLAGDFFEVGN